MTRSNFSKSVCLLVLTGAAAVCWKFTARPVSAAEGIPVSKEMAAAAKPISTEEEVDLGREVAANVAAQFGIYQNEALTEYVNMVGLTVAMSAQRKDVTYRFAILNSDAVNAFAAPGGYIFVTKGLLSILQDEAQLAGVLGHEIAHVTQKHVIKEIQKSRMAKAMIPGYVKAAAEKAEYMSQITDTAIQMLWKGLSREDELESDRVGVEYARAAGYDAVSFKEVLEMLKARAGEPDKSKQLRFLLSTHPKPEDRLKAVAQKIDSFPSGGEKLKERFASSAKL